MTDIILNVENNVTYITGKLESNLYQELRKRLGYYPEDAFFMMKKRKGWDGIISTLCHSKRYCKCFIKKDGTHFPTGLLRLVREFFVEKNIPYQIINCRPFVIRSLNTKLSKEFEPRQYQLDVIQKSIKQQRGLIKSATGSGKSPMIAGIIAQLGIAPFIVYVPSQDLLKQMKDELEKFILINSKHIEVGIIGAGHCDIKDINVMTIQTAVRCLGGKYIKYDDEDEYIHKTEKEIKDLIKKESIKKLIMSAKGYAGDECITGDAYIYTEKGKVRLDEVGPLSCKKVLSFDGKNVVWRNISAFLPRGNRKIIEIELETGRTIKCTKNHPIMTQKGWIQAGNLRITDQILGFVNAAVDKNYIQKDKDIFLDIKYKRDQYQNGNEYMKNYAIMPHYVNVDVDQKLNLLALHLIPLLNEAGEEDIVSFVMDMINIRKKETSNLITLKNKLFWERFWEIRQYLFQVQEVKIPDYHVIMDLYKKNGLCIKQNFYIDYLLALDKLLMEVMEIQILDFILDAFPAYWKYLISYARKEKKELIDNGLIQSEKLDWHGGLWMMEVIITNLGYILKDIRYPNNILLQIGSQISMEKLKLENLRKNIIILWCVLLPERILLKKSNNMSQNVCHTKLNKISVIKEVGYANVYDITVEDTHCFFANDILVHNCQHWASETCQIISDASANAKYRYGMSATPMRDKNDDMLIDGGFGKVISDINASYLIKEGYLIKPKIYFMKIDNMKNSSYSSYPKIYQYCLVENEERNEMIKEIATTLYGQNRNILILCKQIKHDKILEEMIEDSIFLHGSHSAKERNSHLDKMREDGCGITVATSLPYDEMIIIKQNNKILPIEIGILCNNWNEYKGSSVLCSKDGKKLNWSLITKTHKHLRKNNVVRVTTNRNENIYVTENHSLVDTSLNSILPQKGNAASVPVLQDSKIFKREISNQINLLDLFKDINDDSLEVEILNLDRYKIRDINLQYKYINDPNSVSNNYRLKCDKNLLLKNKKYKEAIKEFVCNFKYYKFRYRAKLSQVYNLKYLYDFFEARIFIRRSRKKVTLPIIMDINDDLALVCGILCAEGHIKKQTCKTAKSRYDVVFTGLEGNTTDGKYDINKKNIRNIFLKSIINLFGKNSFYLNSKQIRINGKLLYYLFWKLGLIDNNGDKRVPNFVFNSNDKIIDTYIYGFYLGDGSIKYNYIKNKKQNPIAILLHNTSRKLIIEMTVLLRLLNKKYYTSIQYKDKKKDHYIICVVDNIGYIELARKKDKLDFSISERKQKEISIAVKDWQDEYVYDISVDDCHNFVSGFGGILAHNSIFDEGINVKSLDTLILAGSGKSSTRALQRIGRILRPYEDENGNNLKQNAIVIDFYDDCKYLKNHSNKRKKIYRTENEFEIIQN